MGIYGIFADQTGLLQSRQHHRPVLLHLRHPGGLRLQPLQPGHGAEGGLAVEAGGGGRDDHLAEPALSHQVEK